MRSKYFTSCKDCKKRSEDCHSKCEEYAKEVMLGIILESDDNKEMAKSNDIYGVYERKVTRIAKSCPGAAKAMRRNRTMRNRGR